jgi:hypothetical protein
MSGSQVHPVPDTFPPFAFPTVFADGVLNATISPAVVKFYLYRSEPSLKGDNQFQTQPVSQIVMPLEGFTAALQYLTLHLESLIQSGYITQARVNEIRQIIGQSVKG